jgi:hypothetical protein
MKGLHFHSLDEVDSQLGRLIDVGYLCYRDEIKARVGGEPDLSMCYWMSLTQVLKDQANSSDFGQIHLQNIVERLQKDPSYNDPFTSMFEDDPSKTIDNLTNDFRLTLREA